ncbi:MULTISPECIES: hypothetical protein [Streptomyces]|uniref:hypothetical protein n=1 Tax=Streptomyces TaxID=1883 RepID=UPI00131DFCE2|nr:hypothetical protein [Streptomyces sp. CB01201]
MTTDPSSPLDNDVPSFSSPESARPRLAAPRSEAAAPPATFLEPKLRPGLPSDSAIS